MPVGLVYADSSALVKLVITEPESEALEAHLHQGPVLATSRLALVEVLRATAIANPAAAVRAESERLLASCLLIDVTEPLLRTASALASPDLRTLDSIHLASALVVAPDELIAYDRRLVAAALASGIATASPGRL